MLQILTPESSEFIRLLAYDLLVRLEIRSLPVRSLRLFEIDKSVQYGSVQYLAEFFKLPVELILSIGEAGFIYRERKDGLHRDQIYVNKDYPAKQILWNLALAIGALELDIAPYNIPFAIPQNLRSVTDFAYYFTGVEKIILSNFEEYIWKLNFIRE